MIDFTDIVLDPESSAVVLPQKDSIFLTRALERAGIDFDCYGWQEVRDGDAPLAADEAEAQLDVFRQHGVQGTGCIIRSQVPPSLLVKAALSIHVEPFDGEVAEYRQSLAQDEGEAFGSFRDELDESFCSQEAVALCMDEIASWLEGAERGDREAFSVSLDPVFYARSGTNVVHTGIIKGRGSDAAMICRSSQIRILLKATQRSQDGFVLVDSWPDMQTSLAEQIDEDAVGGFENTDAYQGASVMKRALIRYAVEGEGLPRAMMVSMYGEDEDLLGITAEDETAGLFHLAFIEPNRSSLATFELDGGRGTVCPYAKYGNDQDLCASYAADLDDEAVMTAFAQDFPTEAKAIRYMRDQLAVVLEEVASVSKRQTKPLA